MTEEAIKQKMDGRSKDMIAIPMWIWERNLINRNSDNYRSFFFATLPFTLYALQQPTPPRDFVLDYSKIAELMGEKQSYIKKWFNKKKHSAWELLLEYYPNLLGGDGVLVKPKYKLFYLEGELYRIWLEADDMIHEAILVCDVESECPLCSCIVSKEYL